MLIGRWARPFAQREDLFAAVELSLKFARVKQKARRPRVATVLRRKDWSNSTVTKPSPSPSLPLFRGREGETESAKSRDISSGEGADTT